MITHPHATRCFLLAVGTVAALGLLLVAQPPLQPALSLVHGESAARTEGATHPETAESDNGCIGNASGYACEPIFFIYGASKCATSSIAQYLVAHPGIGFELDKGSKGDCGPGASAATLSLKGPTAGQRCYIGESKRIDDNVWPPAGHACDEGELLDMAACRRHFLELGALRQRSPGALLVGNNRPANLHIPAGGLRIQQLWSGTPAAAKRFVVFVREPAKRTWSSFNFHAGFALHYPDVTGPERDVMVKCVDVDDPHSSLRKANPLNDSRCAFAAMFDALADKRRRLEACYAAAAGVGSYDAVLALPAAALLRLHADGAAAGGGPCRPFYAHALKEHVDKSIYYDQLGRLAAAYPRAQTFVAGLEAFGADSVGVFGRLVAFLGLPLYGEAGYADEEALRAVLAIRHNQGHYVLPPPTEAEWARAREFFAPYNDKLYAWLAETDDGGNTAFERWSYNVARGGGE